MADPIQSLGTCEMQHVAIFSFRDDLHARLITELIRNTGHHCHHIATDSIAYRASITWRADMGCLRDTDGELVAPADLDTIWWRRVKGGQRLEGTADDKVRSLISVESRTAMFGCMFNLFHGRWVNDPMADTRADNKLVQIHTAQKLGWKVPETLVSNDPEEIRSFIRDLNGMAIVKAVCGIPEISIPTRQVTLSDLEDDDALNACPAIYQELIPGERHLRIHVFGSDILTVQIESHHLDWRPYLDSPMVLFNLPDEWADLCLRLVRGLGLEMGIIDAKLNDNDEIIFLEINPQGQFLFLEPLLDIPLSTHMASFLAGVS